MGVTMYDNNQYPNEFGNGLKTNQYQDADEKQNQYSTGSAGGNAYGDASYRSYDFGRNNSDYRNGYGNGSRYGSVPPLNPAAQTEKSEKKGKKGSSKAGSYFRKALICASLGLIFGLCTGVGLYAVEQATAQQRELLASDLGQKAQETETTQGNVETTASNQSGANVINTVSSDVSQVVKQVMPAMVSIGNYYTEQYSYFGQTFSQEGQAAGSGIIVGENDSELLVVTNYHVIQNAEKMTVTFIDNTEAEAQLKGSDASMDLAVLAVPKDSLSEETRAQILIADLGDSEALSLGEPVIAIGNALGYGQSVTDGIISALNREIQLTSTTTGTFIQTNAAINPGNSGGALLNMYGEVVGINSNKIVESTIEGMGYAIPISAAKPIIEELMLKETKTRVSETEVGYIGILQPATVTEEVAQMYDMPIGVFIPQIAQNSPAEAAGLQKGDIITAIGGDTVTTVEELQESMQYHAAGTQVEITIQRNNGDGYQEMKYTVTLGSRTN